MNEHPRGTCPHCGVEWGTLLGGQWACLNAVPPDSEHRRRGGCYQREAALLAARIANLEAERTAWREQQRHMTRLLDEMRANTAALCRDVETLRAKLPAEAVRPSTIDASPADLLRVVRDAGHALSMSLDFIEAKGFVAGTISRMALATLEAAFGREVRRAKLPAGNPDPRKDQSGKHNI